VPYHERLQWFEELSARAAEPVDVGV
jgi:hypothetical protein